MCVYTILEAPVLGLLTETFIPQTGELDFISKKGLCGHCDEKVTY